MLFSMTVIALIALVIMWACLTVKRRDEDDCQEDSMP